jgi:hypothetical protein
MPKSKLRQRAKGADCQVRTEECNNDRDTTILAHVNERSLVGAGMGMKCPDWFGAHCCSVCHDIIDSRVQSRYTQEEKLIMHYQGTIRTQYLLGKEGLIKGIE